MSENRIVLTRAMIEGAANVKQLLELDPVQNAWVRTYKDVTGRQDGDLRYNAEKILFLKEIESSKALQKADKFSIYGSFIELAVSGLTLRDGLTYLVPFGKKCQFMVGWKGRLEQINEIPNVSFCHEPQVVYSCDDFDYEKGEKVRILRHKPPKVRPDGATITHVYWIIEFHTVGPVVYIMERADVLNIRDNYSESWKGYVKALREANAKIQDESKRLRMGDVVKKQMSGPNGDWTLELEPPMWFSDEAQAFKKTLVHRVWKSLPKLPRHKMLDEAAKAKGFTPPSDEGKDLKSYTGIVDETTGEVLDASNIEEEQRGEPAGTPEVQTSNTPAGTPPSTAVEDIPFEETKNSQATPKAATVEVPADEDGF